MVVVYVVYVVYVYVVVVVVVGRMRIRFVVQLCTSTLQKGGKRRYRITLIKRLVNGTI